MSETTAVLTGRSAMLKLAVFATGGSLLGLAAAAFAAELGFAKVARVVGAAVRLSPGLENQMMVALKGATASDETAGQSLLLRYGYGPDGFLHNGGFILILCAVVLFVGIGLLLLGAEKRKNVRLGRRVAELTAYLEAVNTGRDRLLGRREDEFSLLEDEVGKTVTELNRTKEEAVGQRKTLARHLFDISHQIKTPLVSMSMMTQLIEDICDDDAKPYTERLGRQIARLEQLTSSLLRLSRLDSGTIELEQKPIELESLLNEAAEPLEEMIASRNQRLRLQAEPRALLIGDRKWTAEALLNVIKNCSQHSPDHGEITVSYSQNPLYTEIVVQDTGEGIHREDLPHVFERFYRGKNASEGSIGIGLALSQSIITKQNGVIRAENVPGEGARFIIRFYGQLLLANGESG